MQELLTYEEAARETGRSFHTIKYYVSRGVLKAYPIAHSHRKGIKPEDIAHLKRASMAEHHYAQSDQTPPASAPVGATMATEMPPGWLELVAYISAWVLKALFAHQANADTIKAGQRAAEENAKGIQQSLAVAVNAVIPSKALTPGLLIGAEMDKIMREEMPSDGTPFVSPDSAQRVTGRIAGVLERLGVSPERAASAMQRAQAILEEDAREHNEIAIDQAPREREKAGAAA